jgi:hypothetical protein
MRTANIFFLLMVCFFAKAQAQAQETYTIKPGENILEVVQLKNLFQYPAFVDGLVFFRDSRVVKSKLNYNYFNAQVQFIDGKGDTLTLAEENTIKYIIIARDSFFYHNGYIQMIQQGGTVMLGKRVYFKEFEQKKGAYGLSSGTSAAISASTIIDKRAFDFNTDREMTLVKATDYVFGNTNEFLLADKKNLIKLFPKYKKTIAEYLDDTSINFKQEEDLIKLFAFLKAL